MKSLNSEERKSQGRLRLMAILKRNPLEQANRYYLPPDSYIEFADLSGSPKAFIGILLDEFERRRIFKVVEYISHGSVVVEITP